MFSAGKILGCAAPGPQCCVEKPVSSLALFGPRTHPVQKDKGEVSAPSGKEKDVSTWDLLPSHRQCDLRPHKVSALPPGDRRVKGKFPGFAKVHMDFIFFSPKSLCLS